MKDEKAQQDEKAHTFNTFVAPPEISRTENVTSHTAPPEISQVNRHDTITCCQPILDAVVISVSPLSQEIKNII